MGVLNFITFEIKYHLKTKGFYFMFFILFLFGFLLMATEFVKVGDEAGLVKRNAPYTIATAFAIILLFSAFMSAYLSTVSGSRDFENQTYEFFFTSPIKKFSYFFGRFLGSYIIMLIISISVLIGMMLGELAPWHPKYELNPFNITSYINAFLLLAIVDILFMNAIFFSIAIITRKAVVGYFSGLIFFVLYFISSILSSSLKYEKLSIFIDYLGLTAVEKTVKYWSIAQLNQLQIPFSEIIIFHRILYILLSIMILFLSYKLFDLKEISRRKVYKPLEREESILIEKPLIKPQFSKIKAIFELTLFEIKLSYKSLAILIIFLLSIVSIILQITRIDVLLDTPIYPVTSIISSLINSNSYTFFILIAVLLAGEIIHRDKEQGTYELFSTTPNFTYIFISRFLSAISVFIIICIIYMLIGIIYQAINQYFNFQIEIYLKRLFLEVFLFSVYLLCFSLFIHSLIPHKFLAHMIILAYFLFIMFSDNIKLEHTIYKFPFHPDIRYSDFFGYGHFLKTLISYNLYWGFLSLIFLTLSFSIIYPSLERKIKFQFNKNSLTILLISFIGFMLMLSYLFYNHYILNNFISSKQEEKMRVEYEKKYSKYEKLPFLKMSSLKLNVDIYPYERKLITTAQITYINKNNIPIETLFLNFPMESYKNVIYFEISKSFEVILEDKELGVKIYKLKEPLKPNETLFVKSKIECYAKGIIDGYDTRCNVFYNGTFAYPDLISLGYDKEREISAINLRKKYNLVQKDRLADINDSFYIYKGFDFIDFEAIVSTSSDQIALAPGDLIRTWKAHNRNYFHYKASKPIINLLVFTSGKYKVDSSFYNNIKLYVYYVPQHNFNIKKMLFAMEKSLNYLEQFSPYPHNVLRIVEFPRLFSFAQSLATIIPFSERLGFITRLKNKEDIDYVTFVTAHEVGHQWWGHIISPASVKGLYLITESFAEYTGIRIMEYIYGKEKVSKFLRYEEDRYLKGRKGETYKESPLYVSEGQFYVHYNKGGLVNYATSYYIGHETFDSVLKTFVEKYKYKDHPYPTSLDFLKLLYPAIPDSLLSQIKDFYESIVLYDFKVNSFKVQGEKLLVNYTFKKFISDAYGNEQSVKLNDLVEIGFYEGDKLKEIKRVRILKESGDLEFYLNFKPTKVQLDPNNVLINKSRD